MMNAIANDDEFVEVFVEEAGEVFETIDDHLPVWRNQPSNRNARSELRRGFHTLKGSGRMVNALDLAELAWKVENMLNRVIDNTIQVTEPVVDVVVKARGIMPKMLDAFKEQRSTGSGAEVESLMEQADALAAGKILKSARAELAAVAATAGSNQGIELAKLSRRLESSQQRSDEALRRSEMALQQARRLATHIKATEGDARNWVDHAQLNRVIEQVNRLSKEMMDLRQAAAHPKQEPLSQRRDLGQLIDHRVRERVAPLERQRDNLERQLDEANRAAAASRGLARWALFLSLLVGTGGALAALWMSGLLSLG